MITQKKRWYKGKTLLQALDQIKVRKLSERPLRFQIAWSFEKYSIGTVIVGRVLYGKLKTGIRIQTQNQCTAHVKSIEIKGKRVDSVPAENSQLIAFCVGYQLKPRKFYRNQLISEDNLH